MSRNWRNHKFKVICESCGAWWFVNNPHQALLICDNRKCGGEQVRMIPLNAYDLDNIYRIKLEMEVLSKKYQELDYALRNLPWIE